MTGLEAEILAILNECQPTRLQLVRHFVERRNLWPDSVHRAITRLIVALAIKDTPQGLIYEGVKVDSPEVDADPPPRKRGRPLKSEAKPKPEKPPKYDAKGARYCPMCVSYRPVAEFGKHPRTADGMQTHCRACRAEWMARKRRSVYGLSNIMALRYPRQ